MRVRREVETFFFNYVKQPDDTDRLKTHELYYIDKDGHACDEELWDEILGADDQDVIQLSEVSELEPHSMWVSPGTIKHAALGESMCADIRAIQVAFAEHDLLSMEEWEDGFQRDATPEREIALWLRAANIYRTFSVGEISVERRRDVYRCVVACMVATAATIWSVFRPEMLTDEEATAIVDAYFGGL